MKLKNGMIIKCNSKEDAQEFIKEAHKQGFKWVNYQNNISKYVRMKNGKLQEHVDSFK